MYKLSTLVNGEQKAVQRMTDFAVIPFEPANSDYQAYLVWLSEGNEPLPADEPSEG
jgi:hypothetical protein